MITLFSSFAGVLLTLLVLSSHVLAQRRRGDIAVVARADSAHSGSYPAAVE